MQLPIDLFQRLSWGFDYKCGSSQYVITIKPNYAGIILCNSGDYPRQGINHCIDKGDNILFLNEAFFWMEMITLKQSKTVKSLYGYNIVMKTKGQFPLDELKPFMDSLNKLIAGINLIEHKGSVYAVRKFSELIHANPWTEVISYEFNYV
jgi:hypothetical protein